MPDLNKKTLMPEELPDIRNKNFTEVEKGYTEELAAKEALRCLNCRNKPCVQKCPVNVQIPEFIEKIKDGDIPLAYKIIKQTNSLPAVCGRVCPQERQCESVCVRNKMGESVAIGRLERFAADFCENETPDNIKRKNGKKVAVIGSGPASLTAAGDLINMGYSVTVFEALHELGGVLVYGIPEFRLPKSIVKNEINKLKALGVEFETNVIIGRTLLIDELLSEYSAVFIGTGAGLPRFMNIKGESLKGVYSANEFLTRINLMKAYKEDYDTPFLTTKSCAVIGGGNVAMDVARCAKRLGAVNVYVIYRRTFDEMPARIEEIHHAKEEGIVFKLLSLPVEIISDGEGRAAKIKCIEMTLSYSDDGGRRAPRIKENSEFEIDVDMAVIAIGNSQSPLIAESSKNLKTDERGCIAVNQLTGETSCPGVFAGGDAVTGAATVISAMGAGKRAALAIDEYIKNSDKDD